MISIIIPLYNREKLVQETLDSIVAQTYADWECIVVDDHSTDRSVEVVQKYVQRDSRIKLLSRPEDRQKGACACRNYGFENSTGDLVYFFDSDDLLSPEFLETVDREMAKNPEADYAVFPMDRFAVSPDCPSVRTRSYSPARGSIFKQILTSRIKTNTPSLVWRRRLLIQADMLWDEQHRRYQEGDFIVRMLCLAHTGVWLDIASMVHIRLHGNSMGGQFSGTVEEAEIMLERRKAVYRYCEESGKLTPEIHAILMKTFWRFQLISICLHGQKGILRGYYQTIKEKSRNGLKDRLLVCVSWLTIQIFSILRFFGKALKR